MSKETKIVVFSVILFTALLTSMLMICLSLKFNFNLLFPMIFIGIGTLTGCILLANSDTEKR